METVNDRIVKFMNEYDIRMVDLAKRIGVTQAAISKICNNKCNASKQTLTSISQAYNVNLTWLMTGVGEMKSVKSRTDEIAQITATLFSESENSFKYKFIKLISELDESQINELKNIVDKLSMM